MARRILTNRCATSSSVSQEQLLLRDFIQRSLYDPIHGYFSKARPPVLGHGTKLKFQEIESRVAYQRTVAETYSSSAHGWMTPVELFSPYFSRAVANRIRSVTPTDQRLNIVEIGAGRGTLAADMLQYWSECAPDFLENVSYKVIEISSTLVQLQSKILHPWIASGCAEVHHGNAIEWFKMLHENVDVSQGFHNAACHIIGMEVLDNLPHDLVRVTDHGLEQALMMLENGSDLSCLAPLRWTSEIDKTTRAAIESFDCLNPNMRNESGTVGAQPSFFTRIRNSFENMVSGGTREVWVPTASFRLMEAICSSVPHANITISDFDSFPGSLPGENGPVVQSVERGSAVVYDAVESAPFGKVDVMFPTNFHGLQRCHEALSEGNGIQSHMYRITGQQQFFEEHSSESAITDSTCKDGYNPILQDFENASFFLVDPLIKATAHT